jgi:hypothetical protein
MAKISNTTSYPNAAASPTDYVIGTDVSDNNNTKTFTLQDIANLNAFSPGSGTVTSVGMSGASTGLTFTSDTVSPIVNTGTFTLGGSLGFANGGTGLTALGNAGEVLKVNSAATGFEFGLDASGPGSGTIGRMAYWTTGANPGVLGSAPIKYTPASTGPTVNELTEIISNSATHNIKIGTEATSGLLTLGSLTNGGTQVFSGGTLQLYSADNDGAIVQGGILAGLETSSRSGTINIVNRNSNPASGAITSSVNIGSAQNSASVSDAVNIHKPLYSHSDTFCVGSSGSTQLNVGYDELAGNNFANQRFTVNSATATTQLKLRGRTSDGSSILDLTNYDTYGSLGFNGNSATGSPVYINNVTNQLSTLNFGGPNNDQMVLYVNNSKTNNAPSTTNGGLKIAGSLQLFGEYAIKAGGSTWQTGSDERYKENIIDADLDICYNNIKNLKLKRFNYKEEVFRDPASDNTKLGFIAQEVNEIFPKSVVSTPFTTWVNYGGDSEILGSDGVTKIKPGDRVQDVLAGSVVVDDFKTMNEEQILRSMYGAFKKMQEKIESLEAKVKVLEG